MQRTGCLTACVLVLALVISALLLPGCTAQPTGWTIRLDGIEADTIRYSKGTVNYQVSVIERDGKFGLIDYEGNMVVPLEYDEIELAETDYGAGVTMLHAYKSTSETAGAMSIIFEADGTVSDVVPSGWGYEGGADVYWHNDQPLVLSRFDGAVGSTYEAYAGRWYPQYNLLGTIVQTAPTIVPVQHINSYAWDDEIGNQVVDTVSDKYALLDLKTGKLLTEFVYEDHSSIGFVEGILPVKKDGKWGYINEKGEALTEFIYDASEISDDGRWSPVRMYASTNGYTVVRRGDTWGLIDKSGNTIVEPVYEDISQVNDKGLFWIKRNGRWAVAEITNG